MTVDRTARRGASEYPPPAPLETRPGNELANAPAARNDNLKDMTRHGPSFALRPSGLVPPVDCRIEWCSRQLQSRFHQTGQMMEMKRTSTRFAYSQLCGPAYALGLGWQSNSTRAGRMRLHTDPDSANRELGQSHCCLDFEEHVFQDGPRMASQRTLVLRKRRMGKVVEAV